MAISWLKSSKDCKSFKLFKAMGMDVFDITNLDETDKIIKELVDKKYSTIVISSEVASFSQDIIKKYKNKEKINIVIAPYK